MTPKEEPREIEESAPRPKLALPETDLQRKEAGDVPPGANTEHPLGHGKSVAGASEPPKKDDEPGEPVPILPEPKPGSLLWRVGGIVRTLRPQQWVKNLFVVAPIFFAKDLLYPPLLWSALAAFLVFSCLAGAVYTMNDIVDVEGDRVHPVKRHRPIASGRVPIGLAKVLAAVLVIVALGAGIVLGPWFAAVIAAYFVQNVAYSFRLKKIAYVDVALIALGFVLRVLAGGLATHVPVSGYILSCTALLALFLGFGKRRHELAQATHGTKKKQREALEAYTPRALTVALALTGVATEITYVAYTLDPATRAKFQSDWLWLTAPFTLFGMIRFLQLVTTRPKAESPTQEILRDVPFILNLVVWAIVVGVIVYRLRPGVS